MPLCSLTSFKVCHWWTS